MATPIDFSLHDQEVDLLFVRLVAEAEIAGKLARLLSPDERDRAVRFHFDEDRNSFVLARGVLRLILSKYLRMQPEMIRFSYSFHGKPGIVSSSNLKFNVSHSAGVAFYAVCRNQEIGADLELVRSLANLEGIAQRYFSHTEYCDLLSLSAEQRLEAFFHCWSRKEAFVKAIGEGLSYPLHQFQVTLRPGEHAKLLQTEQGTAEDWLLHTECPWPGFVSAVAVENRYCVFRVSRFDSIHELHQVLT